MQLHSWLRDEMTFWPPQRGPEEAGTWSQRTPHNEGAPWAASLLLAHHVFGAAGILANALDEFRVRDQAQVDLRGPRLGVSLGIVNRNADLQIAYVPPPEAFGVVQSFSLRPAHSGVDPAPVVESDRIHYHRVALPLAHRVAF